MAPRGSVKVAALPVPSVKPVGAPATVRPASVSTERVYGLGVTTTLNALVVKLPKESATFTVTTAVPVMPVLVVMASVKLGVVPATVMPLIRFGLSLLVVTTRPALPCGSVTTTGMVGWATG